LRFSIKTLKQIESKSLQKRISKKLKLLKKNPMQIFLFLFSNFRRAIIPKYRDERTSKLNNERTQE
jgi:hypothetical protein